MPEVKAQSGAFVYPQDLLRNALNTYYPDVHFSIDCEPFITPGKPHWAFDNYRLGGAVGYDCSHLFYTQPGWGTFFEQKIARDRLKCVTYACDPELHKEVDVEKIYDVGFIGQGFDPTGERQVYLDALIKEFNCFISDSTPSGDISLKLSQCKVLFNHIRYEEVNIRFFEELAIGPQVVSHSPALGLIAEEEKCYHSFRTPQEAVDKVKFLLKSESRRKDMAKEARKAALRNTYRHRAEEMLRFVGAI